MIEGIPLSPEDERRIIDIHDCDIVKMLLKFFIDNDDSSVTAIIDIHDCVIVKMLLKIFY